MEPVRAHGLVPVARDLLMPPVSVGAAGAGIGGVSVDAVEPGQDDWIVIVIELVGEEIGAGEAVVLRPVVPVVLVSRDACDARSRRSG